MAGQNQTQNMDLFDAYFRRADLDQDGRITGSEAVAFFQGFNLPKQVLAQIWMHADQNRTGVLGRAEFYNALKLATVAQSKRELTPDIVKAALYGPASAKIPAPQINLAGLPTQSNSTVATPVPQVSGAAPTASQHIGIRGPQVPVNASMDQQVFPSQHSQFMRPPRPMPPGSAFRPQQIVASQGMPGGVTMAASRPPSSAVSTDWLGGRTGGTPAVVTSQLPNRGNTIFTTPDGFGLAAPVLTPSAQPRPQTTTGLMQSAAPKPHDPTFPSNQVGTKDSKALVVAGNGICS
ncbi:hypothetical protein F0562_004028 [Nyssa sinensis]|uniref:EF-hand domain-containing protein n=1 Tax=Nyssa sinensis TaxID=561372 RepID=A0A5J5BXH3_9ASTE|nr:hypothetical protein F0562_004028 [Nyssa sinensis]